MLFEHNITQTSLILPNYQQLLKHGPAAPVTPVFTPTIFLFYNSSLLVFVQLISLPGLLVILLVVV